MDAAPPFTIRSFIAIPLGLELIARIEKTQKELRTLPADVKWVNPQSIHLTLKFLGNIEERSVEDIAQGIQNSMRGFKPWSAAVRNVGAFPSLRSPRVVWVGIEGPRRSAGWTPKSNRKRNVKAWL